MSPSYNILWRNLKLKLSYWCLVSVSFCCKSKHFTLDAGILPFINLLFCSLTIMVSLVMAPQKFKIPYNIFRAAYRVWIALFIISSLYTSSFSHSTIMCRGHHYNMPWLTVCLECLPIAEFWSQTWIEIWTSYNPTTLSLKHAGQFHCTSVYPLNIPFSACFHACHMSPVCNVLLSFFHSELMSSSQHVQVHTVLQMFPSCRIPAVHLNDKAPLPIVPHQDCYWFTYLLQMISNGVLLSPIISYLPVRHKKGTCSEQNYYTVVTSSIPIPYNIFRASYF